MHLRTSDRLGLGALLGRAVLEVTPLVELSTEGGREILQRQADRWLCDGIACAGQNPHPPEAPEAIDNAQQDTLM